jgi:hypothetical protein
MLALMIALSGPPAPTAPWIAGRILTLPHLHVGVRPALFVAPGEIDAGVTVQVSTKLL